MRSRGECEPTWHALIGGTGGGGWRGGMRLGERGGALSWWTSWRVRRRGSGHVASADRLVKRCINAIGREEGSLTWRRVIAREMRSRGECEPTWHALIGGTGGGGWRGGMRLGERGGALSWWTSWRVRRRGSGHVASADRLVKRCIVRVDSFDHLADCALRIPRTIRRLLNCMKKLSCA
ncbi:hypothetical protein Syun_027404 [Stephania yunnanensis]|uniref:Uncharacterized protein n=1 Tax=Stephania yunnanensis TaxID=152371 RepID=A0AAP0EL09_9MAGN